MLIVNKALILSFWLLLSAPFIASAKEKVVLITAVDFWNIRHSISMYKDDDQKFENYFREHFDSSRYELQVKHLASQYDVWQILRSPENAAVFIVAHGGLTRNAFDSKQAPESMIVDRVGFDMTPVFQGINPNLKYLGLLGCYSEGIGKQKSSLVVRGLQGKIYRSDWFGTLDKMMKESDNVIAHSSRLQNKTCTKSVGYSLKIKRSVPSDPNKAYPAVRIEVARKVLGVFPAANPGEESEFDIFIPAQAGPLKNYNFNILLTAGANDDLIKSDLDLGEFDLEPSWDGAHWLLQTDNEGEPMGVTQRFYYYKGSLDRLRPVQYSEYECDEE